MAIKRLSINRTSFLDFADVLRECEPFRTSGSLSGKIGAADYSWQKFGQLDLTSPFGLLYKSAWVNESIRYTVLSYQTPIAFLTGVGDGVWHFDHKQYSTTTSKSQSKIIAALTMFTEPVIYNGR